MNENIETNTIDDTEQNKENGISDRTIGVYETKNNMSNKKIHILAIVSFAFLVIHITVFLFFWVLLGAIDFAILFGLPLYLCSFCFMIFLRMKDKKDDSGKIMRNIHITYFIITIITIVCLSVNFVREIISTCHSCYVNG